MQTYQFARGEDIMLALDAVSGDPTRVSSIAAQLKAIPPGRAVLPAGASAVATFAVSARAATTEAPAGWTLLIPAATSAGLGAGNYLADAQLQIAGGTAITSQIGIRLREAVTS
jgi:hypothetical protein